MPVIGRISVAWGKRPAACAAACVAAFACLFATAPGVADAKKKKPKRPNIVVIQTDDQPKNTFTRAVMPTTYKKVVDKGVSFTEAMTVITLCCPSRATLLTGQYPHNHGVFRNSYRLLNQKKNTLPVWLEKSGYRTAHIGKYMNGYKTPRVAPGWTDWHTSARTGDHYYDYDLSVNGKSVHFGHRTRAHQTRVVTRKSVKLIKKKLKRKPRKKRKGKKAPRPLYLQADYYAPHIASGGNGRCASQAAIPQPEDEGAFDGAPLPKSPNYNEEDVEDKPPFVRDDPSITPEVEAGLTDRYRCALESLRGVDRGVEKIFKALRKRHALGNTVVVFTTDNGAYHGEHRLSYSTTAEGGKFEAKVIPYEEAYRVPFVVRAPKRFRGGNKSALDITLPVANIDFAPTILRLARTGPCKTKRVCRLLDGRSLTKLLRGQTSGFPSQRGLLFEYEGRGNLPVCEFKGIRVPGDVYIEHPQLRNSAGFCEPSTVREHYDLSDDPFQLGNLFPARPGSALAATQASLAARLDVLRVCAGNSSTGKKAGRPLCE